MNQEGIALLIVGITGGSLMLNLLRTYLAPPLSQLLLNHGRARLAFWVRKQTSIKKGSCSNCKSC